MPQSKQRSLTLDGLRHPVIDLEDVFKAISIFSICDDLPNTGEEYYAVE